MRSGKFHLSFRYWLGSWRARVQPLLRVDSEGAEPAPTFKRATDEPLPAKLSKTLLIHLIVSN